MTEVKLQEELVQQTTPWLEPVDGLALANDLKEYFKKYLVLPDGAYQILPLWVLHTYCVDTFNHSPRLTFYSPIYGCGKTTALKVTLAVSNKALLANNITQSAFFRTITDCHPTFFIDEADTFLKENTDMKNVINTGFEQGGYIMRTEYVAKKPTVTKFKTYGACSIASIGRLADTIMSRSIVIMLQRKKQNEHIQKFIPQRTLEETTTLRSKCARFMQDNLDTMANIDVEDINIYNNRQADVWEPLLTIAKVISPECVQDLQDGIRRLGTTYIADNIISETEMLLNDIRVILSRQATCKMFSKNLLTALHNVEDHPWGQISYGQPYLSCQKMANMLRDFGITPKSIRIGAETGSGYDIEWFKSAFETYLPSLSSDTLTETDECQTVRDKSDIPYINDEDIII